MTPTYLLTYLLTYVLRSHIMINIDYLLDHELSFGIHKRPTYIAFYKWIKEHGYQAYDYVVVSGRHSPNNKNSNMYKRLKSLGKSSDDIVDTYKIRRNRRLSEGDIWGIIYK